MSTSGVSAFSRRRVVRIESAPTATGRRAATSPRNTSRESSRSKGSANSSIRCRSSCVVLVSSSTVTAAPPTLTAESPAKRSLTVDPTLGDVVDVGGDVGEQQGLAAVRRDELWIREGGDDPADPGDRRSLVAAWRDSAYRSPERGLTRISTSGIGRWPVASRSSVYARELCDAGSWKPNGLTLLKTVRPPSALTTATSPATSVSALLLRYANCPSFRTTVDPMRGSG